MWTVLALTATSCHDNKQTGPTTCHLDPSQHAPCCTLAMASACLRSLWLLQKLVTDFTAGRADAEQVAVRLAGLSASSFHHELVYQVRHLALGLLPTPSIVYAMLKELTSILRLLCPAFKPWQQACGIMTIISATCQMPEGMSGRCCAQHVPSLTAHTSSRTS